MRELGHEIKPHASKAKYSLNSPDFSNSKLIAL